MKHIRLLSSIVSVPLILLLFLYLLPSSAYGKSPDDRWKQEQKVAFNFVDVDLAVLTKFISEITKKNFIFDERLKGKITIVAPSKLSIDDAYKLFISVLELKGFTAIPSSADAYKIVSVDEARQRGIKIEAPDTIFLKHSNADAVVKILVEGIIARSRSQQPAAGEEPKVVADPRLNAVVLFGDRGMREAMRSLITLLDVPSPEVQGRINVYFLENSDATELAKVMAEMLKGSQARQAPPGAPGTSVSPFESGSGITITADKATNSLVVVASHADYQNLFHVIKQLDQRRRQVFVEALIAEVSVNGLLELGTKWRATIKKGGNPIVIGGVGQVDQTTLQSIVSGLSGLSMGGLGNYLTIPQSFIPGATSDVKAPGFAALFQLSDFKDVVNVISTPQLLTSDNKEAEILVGENVPFIASRQQDVATAGTVLNNIQREDVGVKLRITPQITEGDYVKLDIYQEISAVEQAATDILTTVGPSITKRSTKTSVVVKDGETVVISGLIQDKVEDTVTKVPLLGDIPLLGYLFKTKSAQKSKTNLMVFITPHMIKKAESLTRITKDKIDEFNAKGQGDVEEGKKNPLEHNNN